MTAEPPATAEDGAGREWTRWLRAWTLLHVPPLMFGVLVWGVESAVALSLPVLVVAGMLQAMVLSASGGHALRELVRSSASTALAVATMVPGLGGIAVLSPLLAAGTITLMALSTPSAVRRCRALPGLRRPKAHPAVQDVVTERATPARRGAAAGTLLGRVARDLTDTELCRAWRESYVALTQAGSVDERVQLVALRQSYLDELEARDAAALQAWLTAGARAAGGPDRYVRDYREHPGA